MKKLCCYGLLLCGVLPVATIGCSKSESNNATTAANGTSSPASSTGAVTGVTKPAPIVTDGAGTEPGEVVALFLDSLRRGDETAANGVLTTQAQTELAKTDYVIQPLGTPEGKYKIGRVGFVDGDTTTGLVECLWSEPSPVAGQPPIEMDIVCEVHKEPQGWRISGLAVKMAGTEETLVLDFEDAKSLQQALEGASGQPATPPAQTAQLPALPAPGPAAMPQAPVGGVAPAGVQQPLAPQGLPQYSTLPGQPQLPPMPQDPQLAPGQLPPLPAAPTQIALPPTPSINR